MSRGQQPSLSRLVFRRSALTIATVSLACIIVAFWLLYAIFLDEATDNLRNELDYIAAGVELQGEAYLRTLPQDRNLRITWISTDGQVLFDTRADPALMDNHAQRPEVLNALSGGAGEARRISGTLSEWVIYRAMRISDGTVVRLCLLEQSPVSMLNRVAMPLLGVTLFALVLSLMVSAGTVRRIMDPLNKIDLKNPDSGAVYTELQPLTQRIQAQNEQIQAQMQSMEAAHQAQDRFRREFTVNVSHELKTPLTSISGFAEIIRDGLVRPEDIPHFAGTIYGEAQRLILLVGDIIKIGQMDDPGIPIQREPVDLFELSQEVLSRLQVPAAKAQVSLHLSGAPGTIQGSYQICEEILYNLCDNAIKYNRPGGGVFVSVTPEADHVLLTVRDTGIGIGQEHQGRVFERFYRVDKARSRTIGGTGLGLSIVKHGAMFHGAKLTLESAPGVGTTIALEFPL